MRPLLIIFLFAVNFSIHAETSEMFPQSNKTELRDIALGMNIKNLPSNHFKNYICVNDKKRLNKLNDYKQCGSNENGMYEVGLEFDTSDNEWAHNNETLEGTTVAGYPVILSILIDEYSLIQGIRAFTDPEARSYLKRQAYLLSKRIKSHYGSSNWTCNAKEPGTDGNKPFGPVFIDERCTKIIEHKKVIVESKFYRAPNQTGKDYTNASSMEVVSLLSE